MRSLPAPLIAALSCALPGAAMAQSSGDLPAIQQRQFRMDHEIELSVGVLPLDPFTKTLTGEVTYTYHLSDQLAWEMFRAFYADSFKTSIRQQAEQDYGVAPSTFEEYRFGVSSSLEVAPAYGKFSLMNDNVLHAELLLAVGPMVAWMEQNNVAQIKVGPIGGIGLRLFANDTLSVRLDTRYGVLFGTRKPSTTTLICTVALGVSFDFGHAD